MTMNLKRTICCRSLKSFGDFFKLLVTEFSGVGCRPLSVRCLSKGDLQRTVLLSGCFPFHVAVR